MLVFRRKITLVVCLCNQVVSRTLSIITSTIIEIKWCPRNPYESVILHSFRINPSDCLLIVVKHVHETPVTSKPSD